MSNDRNKLTGDSIGDDIDDDIDDELEICIDALEEVSKEKGFDEFVQSMSSEIKKVEDTAIEYTDDNKNDIISDISSIFGKTMNKNLTDIEKTVYSAAAIVIHKIKENKE